MSLALTVHHLAQFAPALLALAGVVVPAAVPVLTVALATPGCILLSRGVPDRTVLAFPAHSAQVFAVRAVAGRVAASSLAVECTTLAAFDGYRSLGSACIRRIAATLEY